MAPPATDFQPVPNAQFREYVQLHLSNALSQAMTAAVADQPDNPVAFVGKWLKENADSHPKPQPAAAVASAPAPEPSTESPRS